MSTPVNNSDLPPIAEPYRLATTRHGVMLCNRNDAYMGQALLMYGECCEIELQFLLKLLRFPGLVIEVGANMGIHTVPLAAALAKEDRHLLAIEPQPIIFQQLCANLALNGLMNVYALPFACGRDNGSVAFEIPDYRKSGNFGGVCMSTTSPTMGRFQSVKLVRLDDLVPDGPVGLIKIDVEGFEQQVLEGASAILERSHPALYLENDRIEKSPQLIQWLWDHDYQLWWDVPMLFNPNNFRGVKENYYPTICSANMFGLHRSRAVKVESMTPVENLHWHPYTAHLLSQPQPAPAGPPQVEPARPQAVAGD
jgi:FkbM family methyltransferase